MNISTRAATAAGFALTLMLSVNCNYASAQQAVDASTCMYQTPSSATVSMVDTPAAPTFQGVTCGTIGPEGDVAVVPIAEETAGKVTNSGDVLKSAEFDGGLLLRNFSSNIDQFKGKITKKAFSFLESLQSAGRKDSTVGAPSGYTVIRRPGAVSPAVF